MISERSLRHKAATKRGQLVVVSTELFSETEGVPHSTVHIPHVLHIQCGGVGGYPSVAVVLGINKLHVGRLVSIGPRRNKQAINLAQWGFDSRCQLCSPEDC